MHNKKHVTFLITLLAFAVMYTTFLSESGITGEALWDDRSMAEVNQRDHFDLSDYQDSLSAEIYSAGDVYEFFEAPFENLDITDLWSVRRANERCRVANEEGRRSIYVDSEEDFDNYVLNGLFKNNEEYFNGKRSVIENLDFKTKAYCFENSRQFN
ncbi:hypothetical protein HN992_02730 [Candidatus Woesearchaeota archaeon]|jgi:hypothetical protein|nr:hypothetical protein [Candidatus Woesearchaeota archaeon]MBT3438663.1 hypothetical protein [Candidatus Woesearchaeota archaeon]MBT4058597.1 hypothetical protein [Candidatus Woesearchaeota archaeon]MBT4207005.1 hypothetical protein [Candidatus Woesearchaeota archaeon]MBT4732806.1 hypothetical protein [Candidatus Woesearchaeota archaeon]